MVTDNFTKFNVQSDFMVKDTYWSQVIKVKTLEFKRMTKRATIFPRTRLRSAQDGGKLRL